jgi:glycosyltransferase involved in cell wall biosynthesis
MNTRPELVSILIPAYNAAAWLAGTVRSALDQTWPRKEIIVVDDGSKDGTLAAAKAFESRIVKVIAQPNMGAPAARNTALQQAQGRYIQWLDADDLLEPNKVARQMRAAYDLGDRRALLSCPYGTFYYRPERASFERTSLWRDLSRVDYFLTRFNDNVFFQTSAWLVSRELTEATGLWTEVDSPDDDGEYFCRAVLQSTNVRFIESAKTYYRVGNYGGVNKGRSRRAQTALLGSKVKCIRYALSVEDSARMRAACVRLLQDSLSYFHPERPDLIEQAQTLAHELGGSLERPTLKWKYRPVEWLFGYRAAVSTTRILPRLRTTTARRWDEFLFRLRTDGLATR